MHACVARPPRLVPYLKKLPALPNGASTSGKAEPKREKAAFSGLAKHSQPTAKRSRSSLNTGGPAAACTKGRERKKNGELAGAHPGRRRQSPAVHACRATPQEA